jgi:hypothetical protein
MSFAFRGKMGRCAYIVEKNCKDDQGLTSSE